MTAVTLPDGAQTVEPDRTIIVRRVDFAEMLAAMGAISPPMVT